MQIEIATALPKFPALVGLRKKSRQGPCDEARAISNAIESARGIDVPTPVMFASKLVGWVCGSPW